ncbi:MAG TPA: phosphoribosylglycinamide formyltransferase [Rhizomicrobium sp.]|nr:phosphoribosylglycinamide formyltransferase [Rhizomicrobium sp.]
MKRVAVLISGRGSNLQSLVDAQDASYRIVLVISNIADASGLDKARAAFIPTAVISHAGKSREAFDAEMDAALRAAHAELVVLAGFMRILSDGFVRGWEGKLINIHPSLLPAYKGTRVHERVLEAKEALSGASVHFVVPELDAGPVIAQATVQVAPSDTPQTLAERVLAVEHRLYPDALKLLANGKVALQNGLAVFNP